VNHGLLRSERSSLIFDFRWIRESWGPNVEAGDHVCMDDRLGIDIRCHPDRPSMNSPAVSTIDKKPSDYRDFPGRRDLDSPAPKQDQMGKTRLPQHPYAIHL
jgi:hypothetical protein